MIRLHKLNPDSRVLDDGYKQLLFSGEQLIAAYVYETQQHYVLDTPLRIPQHRALKAFMNGMETKKVGIEVLEGMMYEK